MRVTDVDDIIFCYLPVVNLLILLLKFLKLNNTQMVEQINSIIQKKIDELIFNDEYCKATIFPKEQSFCQGDKEFCSVKERKGHFNWRHVYRAIVDENRKLVRSHYINCDIKSKCIQDICLYYGSMSTICIRYYGVVSYCINKNNFNQGKTLSVSWEYLQHILIDLKGVFGIGINDNFNDNVNNICVIIWILNKNILFCKIDALNDHGKNCGYKSVRIWHKTVKQFDKLQLSIYNQRCILYNNTIFWIDE